MIGQLCNKVLNPLGVKLVRVATPGAPTDFALYGEYARPQLPKYVNIGAGSFFHPLWHNLDNPHPWYSRNAAPKIDIGHDLMSGQPLAIEDGSLRIAYTSHTIEHLRDEDVALMFAEVYRCLAPGGYFRITCPDIDLDYDAYLRGDLDFWWWPSPNGGVCIEERFVERFASALVPRHPATTAKQYSPEEIRSVFSSLPKEKALDYFSKQVPLEVQHAYPGNHMNWFNENKLTEMLGHAGFERIWRSRFRQSKCAPLRNAALFDRTDPELSLYIECQK
ncbi:MAG TPA: methyltransferase domain-containing protein [Blastocatellia bacterium]